MLLHGATAVASRLRHAIASNRVLTEPSPKWGLGEK